MNRIDRIIAEEIGKVVNTEEEDKKQLRSMIAPYVRSFDIDMGANEGTAKVSFKNEKDANSAIDMWRRSWPSSEGYEILSVEPLQIGEDFSSIFAISNGGACMYKITFKKSKRTKSLNF